MPFTITLGEWLYPLLITIALFVFAAYKSRSTSAPYGSFYGSIGDAVVAAFWFGLAVAVSLIVWLIYVSSLVAGA